MKGSVIETGKVYHKEGAYVRFGGFSKDGRMAVTYDSEIVNVWSEEGLSISLLGLSRSLLGLTEIYDPNSGSATIANVDLSRNTDILIVVLDHTIYVGGSKSKWMIYAIRISDNSVLREWRLEKGDSYLVPEMKVSPNGELLAVGHSSEEDPYLTIFNIESGESTRIPGVENKQIAPMFSEDSKYLALMPAGYLQANETITILDTKGFTEKVTIGSTGYGFEFPVMDGVKNQFVGCDAIENSFYCMDIHVGAQIWHESAGVDIDEVIGSGFHSDKELYYFILKGQGVAEYYITFLEALTGKVKESITVNESDLVDGTVLSDSVWLISFQDRQIQFHTVHGTSDEIANNDPEIIPQLGHYGQITQVMYSPDGRLIGSYGNDRTKVIDVKTGKEMININDTRNINGFSKDGQVLFYETIGGHFGINIVNGASYKITNPKADPVPVYKVNDTLKIRSRVSGQVMSVEVGDLQLVDHLDTAYVLLTDGSNTLVVYDAQHDRFIQEKVVGDWYFLNPVKQQIYVKENYGDLRSYDMELNLVKNHCEDFPDFECPFGDSSDAMAISPDGNKILLTQYGIIEEWDIVTATRLLKIEGLVTQNLDVESIPGTESIVVAPFGKAPVSINLHYGTIQKNTSEETAPFFVSDWAPQNIISSYNGDYFYVGEQGYNQPYRLVKSTRDTMDKESYGIAYNDRGYSVNATPDGKLNIFNDKGALLKSIKGQPPFHFTDNGKLFYRNENRIFGYDIASGARFFNYSKVNNYNSYATANSLAVDHQLNFLAYSVEYGNGYGRLIDIESGEEVRITGLDLTAAAFFTDENLLITGSELSVNVFDPVKKQKIISLPGHKAEILSFSDNDRHLFSASMDGTVKIWDKAEWKLVASVIIYDSLDMIITTPDNYYLSTKQGTKGIAFKVRDSTFPFEQFDLRFNRPDIVLERLGYATMELIESFGQAYEKRVLRSGFSREMLEQEFILPEVEVNGLVAGTVTYSDKIGFQITAKDSMNRLNRINVWVNDVPLYGMNGLDVSGLEKSKVSVDIELLLSPERNKIQVSCHNEKGIESLRETFEISYASEEIEKPDLYLVNLSVSDYMDDTYDLRYAVKDGRDLVDLLSGDEMYANIYYDTLYNDQVIIENFQEIKSHLMQSGVNDHVVVFVSGHGLLDANYDFYFATHDIDFDAPNGRGISYQAIEGLLDGIPSRKKVLLMDACHSGEVDKEGMVLTTSPENKSIVSGWSGKGAAGTSEGNGLKLSDSFELMQELFANLSRGSGAVVISAAAGDSYALESDEWQNGVFTYCIKNALGVNREGVLYGDLNLDGQVSVTELKTYVIEEVQKQTDGLQRPTSRRENLEFDFVLK